METLVKTQMEKLGKNLAETVLYGACWYEALDGDEMETLILSFVDRLAFLMGGEDDVFIQEIKGLKHGRK